MDKLAQSAHQQHGKGRVEILQLKAVQEIYRFVHVR